MASKINDSTDVKNTRIYTGVLQSITTLLLQCAKHAIIATQKLKNSSHGTPKKLISSITNKVIKLLNRKKKAVDEGELAVWQKDILMGDRCQPLDFSGVIYYDKDGNLVEELSMRSLRATPLPGYNWTPKKFS